MDGCEDCMWLEGEANTAMLQRNKMGLLPYDLYLGQYLSLKYKAPVCIMVKERRWLFLLLNVCIFQSI